jgi:diacylglycerol kinase family enzyme
MGRMLVIANRDAGAAADAELARALAVLRGCADVELRTTGDARDLDRALAEADGRTVVVAGGDGSLHAVVGALHRRGELTDRVLALVPLGTGNDFARGLRIPLDTAEAARQACTGAVEDLDLVVDDSGGAVVNNVHAGAGAQASVRGQRWKDRLNRFGLGRLGYPIGAAMTATRNTRYRLRVEVDGEVVADVDRPVLAVAIGNSPYVGGGTAVTPRADPDDGKVEVMVSFATGRLTRLGFALRLLRAEHYQRPDVRHLRASRVAVSGAAFSFSADGEIRGPVRRREWHVERNAWRLVVG